LEPHARAKRVLRRQKRTLSGRKLILPGRTIASARRAIDRPYVYWRQFSFIV
jgi:hypothetical protein